MADYSGISQSSPALTQSSIIHTQPFTSLPISRSHPALPDHTNGTATSAVSHPNSQSPSPPPSHSSARSAVSRSPNIGTDVSSAARPPVHTPSNVFIPPYPTGRRSSRDSGPLLGFFKKASSLVDSAVKTVKSTVKNIATGSNDHAPNSGIPKSLSRATSPNPLNTSPLSRSTSEPVNLTFQTQDGPIRKHTNAPTVVTKTIEPSAVKFVELDLSTAATFTPHPPFSSSNSPSNTASASESDSTIPSDTHTANNNTVTTPTSTTVTAHTTAIAAVRREQFDRAHYNWQRIFWLMRTLANVLAADQAAGGGFIAQHIFIPRTAWYQDQLRMIGFLLKLQSCEQLLKLITTLQNTIEFYKNSQDKTVIAFQAFVDDITRIQNNLAFQLSCIEDTNVEKLNVNQSAALLTSAAARELSAYEQTELHIKAFKSSSAHDSESNNDMSENNTDTNNNGPTGSSINNSNGSSQLSNGTTTHGNGNLVMHSSSVATTSHTKNYGAIASNTFTADKNAPQTRYERYSEKVKNLGYAVAKSANRITRSALPDKYTPEQYDRYTQVLISIFKEAQFMAPLLVQYKDTEAVYNLLLRIGKFYQSVLCTFVCEDITVLIGKYMQSQMQIFSNIY